MVIAQYTYQDVNGFFSKHFEGKPWTERTKEIYQAVQNAVCKWWFDFQDEFLSSERGVYYTSATKDLTGCEAKRQIDLFVKPNNEKLSK